VWKLHGLALQSCSVAWPTKADSTLNKFATLIYSAGDALTGAKAHGTLKQRWRWSLFCNNIIGNPDAFATSLFQ